MIKKRVKTKEEATNDAFTQWHKYDREGKVIKDNYLRSYYIRIGLIRE